MKKGNLLLFLIFAVFPASLWGQQDPLFSHYMFNRSLFNPGYFAVADGSHAMAGHRTQWFGYNATFDGTGGAPSTQYLSVVLPSQGKISGFGINFINDQLGPVNLVKLQTAIAYTARLNKGSLSIGIAPSANILTLNFNELRFVDPTDPLNIGTKQSQFQLDLDLGLVYSTNQYDIGISVQNLLEPSYNFGISDLQNNQLRSYVATAAYHYSGIYDWVITPSALVRSDLISTTFDISTIATYKEGIWGGLSYRYSEAIILLLGYSFMEGNKLRVGYSFDYILNNQNAKQPTSHEIFMRYNLPPLGVGAKKAVRTPRFIF